MKKLIIFKFDIYEFLCTKIVNLLTNNLKLNENDTLLINLGVEVILLNLFKFLVLFILALSLGLLKEVLLIVFIFALLRVNAAGFHLKSNIGCTLAIVMFFIGSAYISTSYTIDFKYSFIISVFISIVLSIYCPADTENRPILNELKRKMLKIRTIIIVIILLITNILIKNDVIMNITMFVLLIQTVSVHPLTYKLMNQKYNNYKEYE